MTTRLTLAGFLSRTRTALKSPLASGTDALTFVVGNESADLDSLCSAVVLAYLRSNATPHRLHIPIANLPRSDLSLRTEMTAVLKHADLSPSDLITLSDLPDLTPEQTRWILVDHNGMTGSLKSYASQVVGCVDHHVDEHFVKPDAEPRIIEPCGSCMSLVVTESKRAWEEVSRLKLEDDSQALADEDDKLAKLALAPILTDTINMKAEHKVKDKDVESVEFLKGKVHDPHFDATQFWQDIQAVKEDVSRLSLYDNFRKDYKEWTDGDLKVGISSVIQNFDYLLEQASSADNFLVEFSKWAEERQLDVAAIMTTSHPQGEFQRHLLVWGRNQQGQKALDMFREKAGKLQLESWGEGKLDKGEERFAWRQHDLTSSRKQVAPLLREAMKEASKL